MDMSTITKKSKKYPSKIERLFSVIEGKKTALIVSHTNPDPDSIASALALQYFLQEMGKIKSTIALNGIVGRAENQALIEYLNMDYKFLKDISKNLKKMRNNS